jgi:hypothetical protein
VIAGFEDDQIARHEVAGGEDEAMAGADDGCVWCGHFLEGRQRVLCPRLLDHAQHRVEDDDGDNGPGVDEFAQEKRNDGRDEEDGDEEILELVEKQGGKTGTRSFFQFIRPVFGQTPGGLSVAQSLFRVGGKLLEHLVNGLAVHERPLLINIYRVGKL